MAWEIVDIVGFKSCKFPSNFLANIYEQNRELFVINSNNYTWENGDSFWDMPDSSSDVVYFYSKDNFKLGYQKYDVGYGKWCYSGTYANGYTGGHSFNTVNGQNQCTYAGFSIVKNDETRRAQVVVCWELYFEQLNLYELHGYCAFGDWQVFPWLYNWVMNNLQPTYNWQSVPSISGKNGISQPLSSHLDINDGEPITTSDTTKYSLNSNSNINKLVQDKLNS